VRILQSIAAGLVGRQTAFAGGWPTAALGLALHFSIATTIAAVFVMAARMWPRLAARPLVAGPIYGVIVYLVMNVVVIPLSAAPATASPPVATVVNGVLIHMCGVGLPAVLWARAASRRR
jgi:uncharacterized membrane protein YagU involved in acid resistance